MLNGSSFSRNVDICSAVDNDDARLMEGLDKRGPDAKSPFAEDYPIKG